MRRTRIEGALKEAWGPSGDVLSVKLRRWVSLSLKLTPREIALEAAAWKNGLASPSYLEKKMPKIREEQKYDERVGRAIRAYSSQMESLEDPVVRYLSKFLHKL